LKFKQAIVYLTIGSIPAPKGGKAFPNKESIPMLALVIRIHNDNKINIRRLRCNEISGPSHHQMLVKYKNLSIHKMKQIKN
jgi:hypothetical protein